MKSWSYLINVVRGLIVFEEVFIEVLKEGEIVGVGLDVFENEL